MSTPEDDPASDVPVVDTTPDPPAPPVAAPDPVAAVATLKDLFATLVPPDKIEISDALGNRYQARAALPARAQIMVIQHLERLAGIGVSPLESLGGGLPAIANLVVTLARDPDVLNGIADAFGAAHPKVVAGAVAASKAEGDGYTHPADLFAVEELVAGLVPFFIRFAAKAADLISQVMPEQASAPIH